MRQQTENEFPITRYLWEICKHGKLPYSNGTSFVSGIWGVSPPLCWERSKPTTPCCKDINKFPNEEWRFSSGGNHGSPQQELYEQPFCISEHFSYMGTWRIPVSGIKSGRSMLVAVRGLKSCERLPKVEETMGGLRLMTVGATRNVRSGKA
ncbi:hypothetical protein AAG906_005979 [Vitis piasezkii]